MTKMINKTTKLYAGDKFAITTTDGRKLRLVIEQDEFPEDPRSWDNIGTMLCCHREYQLGDCNSNRETEEQLAEICREYGKSDEEIDEMTFAEEVQFILDQDNVCGLPLWLYDHSGISMSTERQCSWDSSFVGLIFVEKDFYLEQSCLKDEVDWKVSSDEYEYGENNQITIKGKAAAFNFKVGDWITVGFLDEFGDIDYRRSCKVIDKTDCELICTWHY